LVTYQKLFVKHVTKQCRWPTELQNHYSDSNTT